MKPVAGVPRKAPFGAFFLSGKTGMNRQPGEE